MMICFDALIICPCYICFIYHCKIKEEEDEVGTNLMGFIEQMFCLGREDCHLGYKIFSCLF